MKPRDVFGQDEAVQVAPSEEVRHWDLALIAGGMTLLAVATASVAGLWAIGNPTFPRMETLGFASDSLRYFATLGRTDSTAWEILRSDWSSQWRLGLSFLLAAASSTWMVWKGSQPQSRVRHIEGPQLREGKDALQSCRMAAERQEPFMNLHPSLPLGKRKFTRHVLIVGAVGGGKTQVLYYLVKQLVGMGKHGKKAIIVDIKKDWTAALPEAALVSPWDSRSYVWDISADLRNGQDATRFAQSIIPSKEGEFWGSAAQSITIGILHELIHDLEHNKKPWGCATLDKRLQIDPYELKDLLEKYYPAGARLMSDPSSTTALNVLQTVTAHTRVITQLAAAWGNGEGRKKISLRKWARDDYKGRRQIILQAGTDQELTRRYIAAMLNYVTPQVLDLPDNEEGRTIGFVLDEFPSIGKLDDVTRLVAVGRSKGVIAFLGFQAIDQVKEVYGNNFAAGLMSMTLIHVICQSFGDTQNFLAEHFRKRRVSLTTYSRSSSGVSVSQHEEQRQVVLPHLLGTRLGSFTNKATKKYPRGKPSKLRPHGFGIRAIVSFGGEDPLLLEWPGEPMPRLRPEFVEAPWTRGIAKVSDEPVPQVEDIETTPAPLKPKAQSRDDALDRLKKNLEK